MTDLKSPFSAAEQGLGYLYQARFALFKLLSLPEECSIHIEKEDDIEFSDLSGSKSLGSLKHKAAGDALSDLSVDFWKSVRIWLRHYMDNGRITCGSRFFLFTTASISSLSDLAIFLDDTLSPADKHQAAANILNRSDSKIIIPIRAALQKLSLEELADFYARIAIVPNSSRITDLSRLIVDQHLRTVRREYRNALFERLEGWWNNEVILILSGDRRTPISGREVSDKLYHLCEEYKSDNLPITFRNSNPEESISVRNDSRLFVKQLRDLDLSETRIQKAIIDYYRAFEQRSSWARENLLISGEIEEYENRLVDEWTRYREVICEKINAASDEDACLQAGRELYRWAELETGALRIRERVTEPYVVRGTFQMLANYAPRPRVHWHPRFLERLEALLKAAA